MSKLLLILLVTFVSVDPVLSSTNASSNVIDVRGGGHGDRIPYKPFYDVPSMDPSLNMSIP